LNQRPFLSGIARQFLHPFSLILPLTVGLIGCELEENPLATIPTPAAAEADSVAANLFAAEETAERPASESEVDLAPETQVNQESETPQNQEAETPQNQEPAVELVAVRCESPSAELQSAVLSLVNQSRAEARQCGAESFASTAALSWDSRLALAATRHSVDMASNNFFSHTGSDGLKVGDRTMEAGFNFGYVGENIAAGYATALSTHEGLLESSGHCANIMRPAYQYVGAACSYAAESDFRSYWTFVFGAER